MHRIFFIPLRLNKNPYMELYIGELSNGIKFIHKQVNSPVAHCGVIINAGSRDERENEHGLAHLIEHMVFKGTKHRKAYHIFSRLEDVGGEMNAYTTKEETCVHATFLTEYYSRAVELLSDVLFNSVFDSKELVKEMDVVLDEINSYKDSPSEQIMDDFDELIFHDHPMGRNILGDESTLKGLSRDQILEFIKRNYVPQNIVISSVGNISGERFKSIVSKYFDMDIVDSSPVKRIEPGVYVPSKKVISRNTYQAHCMIGARAYHIKHKDKMVMYMLNNLLGGPALNSRLNMSVREKNGLAYSVESAFQPFSDTGIFTIYLGTDKEMVNRALRVVKRELDRFRNTKLGVLQLSKAKKQLIGYLTMSAENHESLMLSIGKSLLFYGKVDPLTKVYEKIEAITSEQIIDVANDVFEWDKMSKLVFE